MKLLINLLVEINNSMDQKHLSQNLENTVWFAGQGVVF